MTAFSSVYSGCWQHGLRDIQQNRAMGEGTHPCQAMQAAPRIRPAGSLRAHISIACAPPHAGTGAFEPAGVGRPLPSSLQHPQLGFILTLWDPLQKLLPRTVSHCCLPVVLAPGKVPATCWALDNFFPIIFTNSRQFFSLCLSLFAHFVFSFR